MCYDRVPVWYAILASGILRSGAAPPPTLPKVIAHNLSRRAAEQMQREFGAGSTAGGEAIGVSVFLWEYDAPHAATDPGECTECPEIVLEHVKYVLSSLEKEAANRGLKILQENFGGNQERSEPKD